MLMIGNSGMPTVGFECVAHYSRSGASIAQKIDQWNRKSRLWSPEAGFGARHHKRLASRILRIGGIVKAIYKRKFAACRGRLRPRHGRRQTW